MRSAVRSGFASVKPAQVPQEKNGEQPSQSFSFCCFWLAVSFLVIDFAMQSSAQQGLTESSSTYTEKRMQRNFTEANIGERWYD